MNFKKSRVLFLLPALIIVGLAACNRPKQVGQQPSDQSAGPGSTGSGPAGEGVPGEGVVDLPSAGTTNSPALAPYPEKLVPVQFSDVTAGAGIRFRHNNGASGKKYLPETTGSGCAFLDYDRDGWPDILLINGMDFADAPKKRRSVPALYHNNQNGTFSDVTAGSGLGQPMYGMGVAIGDYDNDGWDDIFITALGQNRLFRNLGETTPGKFGDVTAKVGMVGAPAFSTSAAWLDYDRDGRLDLFVGNYVDWAIENDIQCSLDGTSKSYCTPESYKGQSARLYHNVSGRFEEVSEKAGVGDPTSKSLGVATFDYNRDGWIDIFVANDTQPNKLYQNNRNGTFTEMATTAGVAFSEEGKARAGMGVDFADYDGSGFPSLIVGNFSNEMLGVYHNEGKSGLFIDEAPASTLGQATLL
ncbi:MAG: FG-GAP repeat domain-containing protein, partial [Blastocatellia bacterium]